MADAPDILTVYRDIAETVGGLALKGKAMRYTAVNGNMFSFLDEGGLCLRLAAADKTEFGVRYGTGDVLRYGSVMRGYVPVPPELIADAPSLAGWFRRSLDFAQSLKPRPGKG
ncbi:MAG: hypothetical protein KDE08_06495 [Rhodobacteraceae bacterium]|nr:hypothetical protein [Paracoccaceae bacterium]